MVPVRSLPRRMAGSRSGLVTGEGNSPFLLMGASARSNARRRAQQAARENAGLTLSRDRRPRPRRTGSDRHSFTSASTRSRRQFTLDAFITTGDEQVVQGTNQSGQTPPTISAHGTLSSSEGRPSSAWWYEQPSLHRYEATSFYGDRIVMVAILTSERARIDALEKPFREVVRSLRFTTTH